MKQYLFSLPTILIAFVTLVGTLIYFTSYSGLVKSDPNSSQDDAKSQENIDQSAGSVTSDTSGRRPLSFAVFTFTNDSRSMAVMRNYYSIDNNDSYVIQSIRVLPKPFWLFDAFPEKKKMIIVQSLGNMTAAIETGKKYGVDTITYDIERWDKTPEFAQGNHSHSVSTGADIAHDAGFKYAVTPDALLLLEEYKRIDWTKVDFLGMQLQRFSQNKTEYSTIAKEISDYVKSKNPQIEVFAQLSFRFADARDMIQIIEEVEDTVDGFIIAYMTNINNNVCMSTCTTDDLDSVLGKIVLQ